MATVNEQIVTGRKFRKLIDEATKLWQRISFWTKANDVEFDDGENAETKLSAINGITDSLTSTSSNIAASAAAVKALNDKITELNSDLFNKIETIFLGACSAGQEMTVKTTKSYRLAIMAVWGYSSNTYTKAENQIEICKNKIFSGMSISAGYVVNCPANANLILYRRGIIDGQVADGVGLIIGIC